MFEAGRSVTYDQLDDDFQMWFLGESGVVRIRASDCAVGMTVPCREFVEGVRAFILSFANEIALRVPAALEWESLAVVKEVVERRGVRLEVRRPGEQGRDRAAVGRKR